MAKTKHKLINIEMLESRILVTKGIEGKEVLKIAKKNKFVVPENLVKDMREMTLHASSASTLTYKNQCIVILSGKPNLDVIPHEAYHATQHILNYRDIFWSKESEEIFAYLIGYLCKEMVF